MSQKFFVLMLFVGIIFSTQGFAEELIQKCASNQYIVGKECVACPADAICNGEVAVCGKNRTTSINWEGRVTCKKSPVATVRNGKVKIPCQKTSHTSINWIKQRFKNCTHCGSVDVPAGKCSQNRLAHKHYYCECSC
ncbi:MAG: hypothetical protein J6Y85_00210 [Alphaproteobacteria bacterium]|nr:hypothetical protein [Alphaproteobacteria bacterium]